MASIMLYCTVQYICTDTLIRVISTVTKQARCKPCLHLPPLIPNNSEQQRKMAFLFCCLEKVSAPYLALSHLIFCVQCV